MKPASEKTATRFAQYQKQAEQFESLIEDVTSKFASLSSDEIDIAIQDGLLRILDFLDMDRGALMEITSDGLKLVHTYARPGVSPGTDEVIGKAKWFTSRVLAGESIIMGRLPEDLPEEAAWEREYTASVGLRAICSVPIFVGGSLFGIVSAASFRYKFDWPDQLVKRIRLIGDIFANALVRKRNEEKIKHQIDKLENQFRFERLISDLTVEFVNLDRGNLDEQIELSIERLLTFFQLDRMALLKVSPDKRTATVTHSANSDGITAAPIDINYIPLFPWHTKKLLAGETVCVNIRELPPEADLDRSSAQSIGIQSNLVIPLIINESLEYVFAANSIRSEREFEVGIIPRIRLLGQTFANALTRKLMVQQRRQAELEAQGHRQELARVSRISAAGELAASIAHELNQPLTGILTNAQAALRFLSVNPLTNIDEVREILHDIVEDDKRAGEVIRRLRSLIKKSETEFVSLDMNRVVEEVVGLIWSDALIRNVFINLKLTENLPQVHGDRIQLQQVLLNLLLNSLDAVEGSKGDQRTIVVRTHGVNEGVFVAVSDFGKGIPKEQIDKIFEPFYTTKREGMGMGLSIARSIIEAHSGEIWAENNVDCGATFFFSLPGKT
jgi:signal transduction histidine kinase